MTTLLKHSPSLEEFLQLPATQPASESIDGEILPKSMPPGEPSALLVALCEAIDRVAKEHKIAKAFPEI